MPVSGARLEKSARKATCNVQRTAAISAIVDYGKRSSADDKGVIIVTYPEAIEEEFVDKGEVRNSILVLKTGEEISMTGLKEKLLEHGFVKTDYVSVPGEFALRGGIIDVFSFSNNVPYRISLFGDEIESIRLFDTNTQLSSESVDRVEIFPDISAGNETYVKRCGFFSFIPKDTFLWIDTVEMFRDKDYFKFFSNYRRVCLGATSMLPQGGDVCKIQFNTSPQPSFNKNFELLTEDLKTRADHGYRICILSDKQSQIERLKSIFHTFGVGNVDFSAGFTIHKGFIDHPQIRRRVMEKVRDRIARLPGPGNVIIAPFRVNGNGLAVDRRHGQGEHAEDRRRRQRPKTKASEFFYGDQKREPHHHRVHHLAGPEQSDQNP